MAKLIALDTAHQQIFTVWTALDRIDVLSTVDYHLIRSITVPSPSTIDISPDGSTLAVGATGAHVLFFSTATFAKTNDIVLPNAGLGISAFLYTANGNAIIRAELGTSTGGGITAYWNAASNTFQGATPPTAGSTPTDYSTSGPIARSGDYSKILLGDSSTGGLVQIIDGNTGQILWSDSPFGLGGYIDGLAANNNDSRYAVCVQIPGYTQELLILNASFQQIYQDSDGCLGITFSQDGQRLYRDASVNSASYTQALDMTSFAATNLPNYFTSQGSNYTGIETFWEASDTSGMIYGMNADLGGPIVFIALDTTSTTAPQIPPVSDPVKIVHVVDNIGSPQGGDTIRLVCTGVDTVTENAISVTIGGVAATAVSVDAGLPMPNERIVLAKTPPGTPGLADVVLTANGASDTASGGFQYAASRTIFPFSTSPNFLLYDPLRKRLYASHKDQVEVIDVASKTVLTPLVPVAGKLPGSQFAGLSLSPDGNRLYIADAGAGMIHILNLASPGQGTSINIGAAIGSSSPVAPSRVFELSSGQLVGSTNDPPGVANGSVYQIDPATQTGQWLDDQFGNVIEAILWNTNDHGDNVLASGGGNTQLSTVGLLTANSSNNAQPSIETLPLEEASANADGTVFAAGGSTPNDIDEYPAILDSNLYQLGLIEQHFDVWSPVGTPSFFLDPTGALLYKAGNDIDISPGFPEGTVEIDDMHLLQPAAFVAFPELFVTSADPLTDHMLTADPTGKYLFGVTYSGITMMTLNKIPLSIGNVQPPFVQPGSAQTLSLRGTGFQSGATVTIGGVQATATYVDPNTLTVQAPSLSAGWLDVQVTLPSGVSYTAPSLLQVIAPQPAPAISGFYPASIAVQSGIPGLDQAAAVTVLGSNFAESDTVEIDGQPVTSGFLDSAHMQATIPADLTGVTGSVAVTVVSPFTGSSNTLALPMVNPLPVPQDNPAISFAAGSSLNLQLYGTGFVSGSIIQWNGQNLQTYLAGGMTPAGLEIVSASVPAALTQLSSNATVTVDNPPPGGGVSAPIQATLGLQPSLVFTLIGPNDTLLRTWDSFPSTIDFGTQVLNSSTPLTLQIENADSTQYVASSLAISAGEFSTTATTCPALGRYASCLIPLTFVPSATGAATGNLTLSDNLPGSPHLISLTGTGVATPLPVVTLTDINALGDIGSASFQGAAVLGGLTVPATAWIEYGTDQTLATYTQSPSWTFTGDGIISGNLSNLSAGTAYAARFAVQTAGGVGRSAISLFSTVTPAPRVVIAVPAGSSGTATVTAGAAATYSLVASDGGNEYVGTASLTCTNATPTITCTVSPSQVSIGVAASPFTVTVTTTGTQTAALPNSPIGNYGWTLCFLFGAGAFANRKRLRRIGFLLSFTCAAFACMSCGGANSGGGSGGGGNPPPVSTPPGIYTLNVNATAAGAQDSYTVQLTVQ